MRTPSSRVHAGLFIGIAMLLQTTAASAASVLFIGNSFMHGVAPVTRYNNTNVTDLNGSPWGGVAGIFKSFTDQSGLSYTVAIEAISGGSLQAHYTNKRTQIGSQAWDQVVMQDYSTLDQAAPGDPTKLYTYSKLLEQFIHGTAPQPNANGTPAAEVYLMQTWARADQVFNVPSSPWYGTSIAKMTADLRIAYDSAAAQDTKIAGVIPVGDSWLMAIESGVADGNPYDGIDSGKLKLWNNDNYHASNWGSYLEALVIFGQITGKDPRSLGNAERAAADLGITPVDAVALQNIAYRQLQVSAVPEPSSYTLMLAGLCGIGVVARRRRQAA